MHLWEVDSDQKIIVISSSLCVCVCVCVWSKSMISSIDLKGISWQMISRRVDADDELIDWISGCITRGFGAFRDQESSIPPGIGPDRSDIASLQLLKRATWCERGQSHWKHPHRHPNSTSLSFTHSSLVDSLVRLVNLIDLTWDWAILRCWLRSVSNDLAQPPGILKYILLSKCQGSWKKIEIKINQNKATLETLAISENLWFMRHWNRLWKVALRFGPKVSVLAYMVRRDAEVVTAHLEIPFDNCFPNPVISPPSLPLIIVAG